MESPVNPTVTEEVRRSFARVQLAAAIEEVEQEAARDRFNDLYIPELVRVALRLDEIDIFDRGVAVLVAIPERAFYEGALLGNIKPTPDSIRWRKAIPTREAVDEKYPVYSQERVLTRIKEMASSDEHLEVGLDGDFQTAIQKYPSGLKLEEIGCTFAVSGRLEFAAQVARQPRLEDFRQKLVLHVLAIESLRLFRIDECRSIVADLEGRGLWYAERLHLALGFAGYEPWDIYPFPDW